ncbi:MAG: hypothetical protein HY255_02750 [Betaproteobacteria bacterium]|nr:hypothetical protein [Betaproteobacteria bacterium]
MKPITTLAAVAVTSILLPAAAFAQAGTKPAVENTSLSIAKYARAHGFNKCAPAVELAERNLLRDSEYTFRAYNSNPVNGEAALFTAIVDSRKIDRSNAAASPMRATLNLTISASQRAANAPVACSTMYEQTMYHNATCQAVVTQMAPNGRPSTSPSLGAVLVEVSDTLSLTLIPVGTAQCVTIIKETAFDMPLAAAAKR